MKKKYIFLICFLLLTSQIFSEETTEEIPMENTSSNEILDKAITAQNEQTLKVEEIDAQELLLKNQNLESSSMEISGEALKEQQQQVRVVQNDTLKIEEELAEGVQKKGFWSRVKDFFTGE